MKKNNLISVLLLAVVALTFIISPLYAADKTAPNFIIVYMDDLGWSDTSVAMMDSEPESKSDFYQTPNLEKLAARGMKFSNAYSPAPTCTPSRKSIQFGKTPGRLKYTFVNDLLAKKRKLTWENEVSMADVLKASGKNYITAHFGKGMGGDRMETIGYDLTDEYDIGVNGNFHGEFLGIKNRKLIPEDDPKRIYSLEKRSLDFLGENAGKRPFFLMVSQYAVHVPHTASAEVIDKYRKLQRGEHCTDEDYKDPAEMSENHRRISWRLQYAAMIDEIDTSVGKMVDLLEKRGQLDNTYIIYTSDNGGGLPPNGPLRGNKAQLFEGGLRVPLVVAGPGVKAGAQCDVPVVQWDFLSTLHDLSGSKMPLPKDLDGGSLRDVLKRGNKGKVDRPVEGLVFHYPCYFAPPITLIRIGDYKYMKHLLTGDVKLFNLKNDYAEAKNLADSMPKKVTEMDKVLTDYLEDIDAEDLQDVYQARAENSNRSVMKSIDNYEKQIARLDPKDDADKIANIKKDLKAARKRIAQSRQKQGSNTKNTQWGNSASKKKR